MTKIYKEVLYITSGKVLREVGAQPLLRVLILTPLVKSPFVSCSISHSPKEDRTG